MHPWDPSWKRDPLKNFTAIMCDMGHRDDSTVLAEDEVTASEGLALLSEASRNCQYAVLWFLLLSSLFPNRYASPIPHSHRPQSGMRQCLKFLGALEFPQQVRAEPGRQAHFGAFQFKISAFGVDILIAHLAAKVQIVRPFLDGTKLLASQSAQTLGRRVSLCVWIS